MIVDKIRPWCYNSTMKHLPIGIQTFRDFYEEDYLYPVIQMDFSKLTFKTPEMLEKALDCFKPVISPSNKSPFKIKRKPTSYPIPTKSCGILF